MNKIDIALILYLILTLLISFVISFLYLNYFRNKKLTSSFTFYFSVFCFGAIIFLIFLVLLDHAISFKSTIEDNSILINDLLNILEIYYKYFGFFSIFISQIFVPLMIFYSTTGFYNKCDIICDVLKRWFKMIFSLFHICLALVLLIPIFVLIYYGKLKEFYYNEFHLILNYKNYYPYLRILFYIGFMIQNYISNLIIKNNKEENENYNLWKLGRIYFYYKREIINIKKNCNIIIEEVEQYFKENPVENIAFNDNYKNFKKYVKFSLTNVINVEPDIESIKLSSKKYKKNYEDKNIEFNLNENDNGNEIMNDIDNDNENENINLEKQIDDEKEYNFLKDIFEVYKGNFELKEKKKCDCSCCFCNCCHNCSCGCNSCNNLFSCYKQDKFTIFKNRICSLMDIVYELCVSIQKKSFLIDKSYSDLNHEEKKENCFLFCCKVFGKICTWICVVFLLFVLLILELPESELIIVRGKSIYDNIKIWFLFFLSVALYFIIFSYSIIHHNYFEGNIIYGNKKSQNVNYYNFISLMLDLINALLFHSCWVLNKSQKIEARFSKVFILKPIYVNWSNIVPLISFTFIIICIYNTSTFSKLKICGSNLFVFNQKMDFFGFNENYYANFLIGCGCLIYIQKNGLENKKETGIKDIDNDIDKKDKAINENENEKEERLLGMNNSYDLEE